MEIKAEYREAFGEESRENLREWEQALLALECDPTDREQLNRLFRCIHTLKGSAGFLGFTEFASVAHALESRLADVREGTRAFDAALVDRLFAGLDLSRGLVEDFLDGKPPGRDAAEFLRGLEEMAAAPAPVTAPADSAEHDPAQVPPAAPEAPVPATTPAEDARTLRIVLCIQGQGREPLLRLALTQARLRRIGTLQSLDPPQEQLRVSNGRLDVTATFRTARPDEEVRAALNVDQVEVTGFSGACDDPSPAGGVAAAAVRAPTRSEEVVRVAVAKLDALLNLVGELVIQNSGFLSAAQQLGVEIGRVRAVLDLEQRTEALGRVVRNLQDGIMKARMLPMATVFERFHRVVRDLAKVGGKTVGLEISGEETEIDKKVIDRIGEPLVHLVRNAVDHGLEPAAQRLADGKPAGGVVRLSAFQEGDHICIEVADDGRGLDRDAIVRKAVEKGLVAPAEAAAATTERIHSLIFLPGFSTAREVSDISGRGVGMDVVKRVVDEMNGSVRVRSTPGRGTAITIAVPLTTAIISAVLVEVGSAMFAVPLSTVREIVRTGPGNLASVGGHRVLRLREDVLALVNLNDALGVGAAGAPDGRDRSGCPALVVDHEGRKICLEVDRIEGTREIVIKSLSSNYREVEGLIGATILGTGRIALIVDAEALIRRFHSTGAGPRAESAAAPAVPSAVAPSPEAPVVAPVAGTDGQPPAAIADAAIADAAIADAAIEEATERVLHSQGTLLEEIHNGGALQASLSLSELTGTEIRVSFPESRMVPVGEVSTEMGGPEEPVGGVYVGVSGDLAAGVLLVVPAPHLLVLDDLLHRRPPGTTRRLEDADQSALSEAANLVAAGFVNAIADTARLRLCLAVPEISVDMCECVVDSVVARFNRPGDEVLLTRARIVASGEVDLACELILFLEPGSLARLVRCLRIPGQDGGVPADG